MHRRLGRRDVNVIMLSGCIISHYNIVDIDGVSKQTGRPVICLTYRESAGIEDSIRHQFDDPESKLGQIQDARGAHPHAAGDREERVRPARLDL